MSCRRPLTILPHLWPLTSVLQLWPRALIILPQLRPQGAHNSAATLAAGFSQLCCNRGRGPLTILPQLLPWD